MAGWFRWVAAGCLVATGTPVQAAPPLLHDDFNDLSAWNDLSTAVTWSGNGSAFAVTAGAARLASFGGDVGSYASAGSLKTFSCLDHRFAVPIDHRTETVTVHFRVRWLGDLSNSGEGNRFNVSFVHDYPAGGLDLTPDTRLADFGDAWWGRPAYQVRIRGSETSNGKTILQYGGGSAVEGEWETYGSGPWWLPGFNSAPGGGSPGSTGNGWTLSDDGLASLDWQVFTYVVTPDSQSLAVDGVVRGTQDIANNVDENPAFQVFDTLEGLRLYWRGANGNLEIDWLTVTVSRRAEPAVPSIAPILVEVDGHDYPAIRYRQPGGGTGTSGLDYTVDGMIYSVEANQGLDAPWMSGPTAVAPVGTVIDEGDGTETVTVRTTARVPDAEHQFLRLVLRPE